MPKTTTNLLFELLDRYLQIQVLNTLLERDQADRSEPLFNSLALDFIQPRTKDKKTLLEVAVLQETAVFERLYEYFMDLPEEEVSGNTKYLIYEKVIVEALKQTNEKAFNYLLDTIWQQHLEHSEKTTPRLEKFPWFQERRDTVELEGEVRLLDYLLAAAVLYAPEELLYDYVMGLLINGADYNYSFSFNIPSYNYQNKINLDTLIAQTRSSYDVQKLRGLLSCAKFIENAKNFHLQKNHVQFQTEIAKVYQLDEMYLVKYIINAVKSMVYHSESSTSTQMNQDWLNFEEFILLVMKHYAYLAQANPTTSIETDPYYKLFQNDAVGHLRAYHPGPNNIFQTAEEIRSFTDSPLMKPLIEEAEFEATLKMMANEETATTTTSIPQSSQNNSYNFFTSVTATTITGPSSASNSQHDQDAPEAELEPLPPKLEQL